MIGFPGIPADVIEDRVQDARIFNTKRRAMGGVL
jgi:hypothetical protein